MQMNVKIWKQTKIKLDYSNVAADTRFENHLRYLFVA